ncbi:MAG: type I-E CRISPR-associated protein Cas6/Cse3/CasE, partial [Boseongicola sp. SB0664_bin_43]|nr:type I-E CRISPR-associated protein Cas6/Cse3/CasE [Boseongicola sp. SB0664_bin_43]
MTHYLTRAVLNRNAPEHALRPLLDPVDKDAAFDAHRRLMWTLFPDPDAKRDFLWRSDATGKFLILSARKPQASRLFEPLDSKPFAPVLAAGDRLMFILRANATRDRRSGPQDEVAPGTRRRPLKDRRVDIVMHAMHTLGIIGRGVGADSRSSRRMDVANQAAREWLSAQGRRRGFSVDALAVEDYR